jgi:hypothetical protein
MNKVREGFSCGPARKKTYLAMKKKTQNLLTNEEKTSELRSTFLMARPEKKRT